MAVKAWVSAEPAGTKNHLILHTAQDGAEERTEMLMFEAAPHTGKPDLVTETLVATIRNAFYMHPEMNLIDDLMQTPVGHLLEPQDDLAAYANAIHRCREGIESRLLYCIGNHLITNEHAKRLLSFGKILQPYVKPFLIGDQAKLHEEMDMPMSDFARGCLSRLIVP
ncbi:hypothetical protein HY492_03010 [Candidatus Woesearchaeota archaeon]|nr:hypothetical protein [Candidatus Woesearchaeota archaeon]